MATLTTLTQAGVFTDATREGINTNFTAVNTELALNAITNAGAIARTATVAGATTGTIASGPMIQFVTVTSGNADYIIILPAPTPGTIVILHVAATGYELRTSDPATIGINGGTGAGAESAIGANVTVVMICATATSWKGFQSGAAGELALVQVAAA